MFLAPYCWPLTRWLLIVSILEAVVIFSCRRLGLSGWETVGPAAAVAILALIVQTLLDIRKQDRADTARWQARAPSLKCPYCQANYTKWDGGIWGIDAQPPESLACSGGVVFKCQSCGADGYIVENSESIRAFRAIEDIPQTALAFEQYLGTDQFERFVYLVNTECRIKGRLLAWMEEAVKDFVRRHPQFEGWDVRASLRICPVHREPLKTDTIEIIYGTFAPDSDERPAWKRESPFANTAAHGPCWHEEAKIREVLYCPQCRAAAKEG